MSRSDNEVENCPDLHGRLLFLLGGDVPGDLQKPAEIDAWYIRRRLNAANCT